MRPRSALAQRGTAVGLIDRDATALAELAQSSERSGSDRRPRRGGRDRPARPDPGGIRDRGHARADRGSGRVRRHRLTHAGSSARNDHASADARREFGRRGSIDRSRLAGNDHAGTGPYRRGRQRGRLSRLSLDDLVLRLEGGLDRLPRGRAARAAPARRDGDHRLPGLRANANEHRHPVPAPGQDDRARRGGPPPASARSIAGPAIASFPGT